MARVDPHGQFRRHIHPHASDAILHRLTIGGRVRQDDMLPLWPSAYPADTALDVFTYAGAPGAYNKSLGAGGGVWWKGGGFSLSASYVSLNGDRGSPGLGATRLSGGKGSCAVGRI